MMKKGLIILLLSITVVLSLYTGYAKALQNKVPANETVDTILGKVYEKLKSIEILRYDYQLELNYASESYTSTITCKSYIDFTSSNPLLGFRYQMDADDYKLVFNGTESFRLDKKQKTLKVNPKPVFTDFASLTVFYNSLVTLRKALPAVIADHTIGKGISDTIFANNEYYLVELVLDKRAIDRLGGFSPLTTDKKVTYKVIIDKGSFMPLQIIQGNSVNGDYMKSIFSNIEINKERQPELSWFYSNYAKEYKQLSQKVLEPIKAEVKAPAWELPVFSNNQEIKLSQLEGKVVLLEFWIKNCGYCISAVPGLNKVGEKFPKNSFQVIGINTHDSKEDISKFYQTNKPNYVTVFNGRKVAEEYGIEAFPSVVLIDKKGKVLFAGGFEQSKIESMIKAAL